MSNIQKNSVIALLNDPDYIKTVLDATLWVAQALESPVGLLYSSPTSHKKAAIDYSGCLTLNNEESLLQDFARTEQSVNLAHKNEGKELLKKAQTYCNDHFCKQPTYPIHRQCTVAESIDYVENEAQLIITANKISCNTSLARLIRSSHCPILIAQKPFMTPNSALLAFDNKSASHQAIAWLSNSPLVRKMCIHLVMVADKTEQNNDALREAYAKLTQAGIKCKKKLIPAKDVSRTIIDYQQEQGLDILISGAFGQSRLREWLQGSDTEKLLNSHKRSYLLFPKS